MEYSELVEAIKNENRAQISVLLNQLTPRLIRFLQIHMNAGKQDAEDCVQQALIDSLEAIRADKVREADRILSFLLTTCRNNYLNLVNETKNSSPFEDVADNHNQKPRQLLALLDQERRMLLQRCMDQLSEKYRNFIEYWFTYPDSGTQAASTQFDMSVSNVWTLKHRVIKKLSECYQKKNEI